MTMENESDTEKAVREHVEGIEIAAGSGHLSRSQAHRVIDAGNKALKSRDMARSIAQNGEGRVW